MDSMIAASNPKPPARFQEGHQPWKFTSAVSSLSGRYLTYVVNETSTRVQITRWTREGDSTDAKPVATPRTDRASKVLAPLTVGDRLGPYQLLKPLGHGAQGEVWKALRLEPFVE